MKKKEYIISMKYPASFFGAKWRDALPSGNGVMGAAVYGGISDERILLNHEDLFWCEKPQSVPDVSEYVQETRKLLLANEPEKAERILSNALRSKGFGGEKALPLPLGDILIHMPTQKAFRNYLRTVNLNTGEVCVNWQDGQTRYARKLFVSRAENAVIAHITKTGSQAINCSITLNLHDIRDTLTNKSQVLPPPQNCVVNANDDFVFYHVDNDNGTEFGGVLKVITNGGTITAEGDCLQISDAQEVTIFMQAFVNGDHTTQFPLLKNNLNGMDQNYDTQLAKHTAMHQSLFGRMKLDLNVADSTTSNEELLLDAYSGSVSNELVEKMWAYGRYLLVSCSNKTGQPCPMYGLWSGEYRPMWSFIMCNENVQMIYWQALSGNIPELLLALFTLLEREMDDYRENAKSLYGCRGIYISGPITPKSGKLTTLQPHIIHWTGGSGWLSQHFYDYYLYTNDINFLKNRALPFMYEAALFYEDFLVLDENGYYMSYPSNSPENNPGNYWNQNGMSSNMETTINATMDFAIVKELLGNLIEGSQLTGLYSEKIEQWKDILAHIPDYQINEDGAIKEWMHPLFDDNYHHRHESHIYPVFPGSEITKESDEKMFKACVIALEKRRDIGLKEQSGWSLVHMANAFARMEKGEECFECLEVLLRTCVNSNLYTFHNDWRDMGAAMSIPHHAPVQLDANMGFVAAVQEMLLFSHENSIKLLPALPKQLSIGSFEAMLAKGNVEVSLDWNMEKGSIEGIFLAKKRCTRIILLPSTLQRAVCDGEWKQVAENQIEVELVANRALHAQFNVEKMPLFKN